MPVSTVVVDHESAGVGLFTVASEHLCADHLRYIGCVDVDLGRVAARRDRLGDRLVVIIAADVVEREHAAQHVVAPLDGPRWIRDRIEARRRLGQSGDHRVLRQAQVCDRFAVVDQRCRADPVGALAEVDLVEVELEDLFLAQRALDLYRQEDLAQLAGVGLLAGQKEVARELHRDGAAALPLLAGQRQLDPGAQQPAIVDPGVAEEVGVLGREESPGSCAPGSLRRLSGMRRFSPNSAIRPPSRAVDLERHLQAHVAQAVDLGQVGLEVVIDDAEADGPDERRGDAQREKDFDDLKKRFHRRATHQVYTAGSRSRHDDRYGISKAPRDRAGRGARSAGVGEVVCLLL
jgi:hypothetical protein